MILAVMGDSHDHRRPLMAAVKRAMDEGAQALFHTETMEVRRLFVS